ncbi:ABC transporter ATP-binding protein [Martelella sp. FOR1707]
MTAPFLRVSGIETHYGQIAALRGVSLDVEAGSIVTILGSNGAGKTTILKTISGVLNPTRGEVVFDGQNIEGFEPDRVARLGLAHVPEGRELFPFLTVMQNLMLGTTARREDDGVESDLEMIFDYLPRLRELQSRTAGMLSGGEQQMVAIGRALMSRPRILLLDEPSLGLSPKLVKEVLGVVARINAEQGLTVLLVEQNAAQALRVAHFGYVIETGRVVMADTCEALRTKEDIKEFYLGAKQEGGRANRRWKKAKNWR